LPERRQDFVPENWRGQYHAAEKQMDFVLI